jgi:phosphatidylserine decarboxylase
MAETDTTSPIRKRLLGRTKFDLEGIGGAVAAWLVGVLLGWLWWPLFWLGFAAAILILMATRSQARVSPDLVNLIIAPCDGIVHSIEPALPPTELRLEGGDWLRVRIASSPFSTNPIYASLTGQIESVILEEPDPSVFTASHADTPGLAVAYIALESLGKQIGYRVSTGGLGRRLEIISEAGDPVRAGRMIGKRRLGGWCDLYLAADTKLMVQKGQTLIGAETVLCRLLRTTDEAADEDIGASLTGATLEEVGQIVEDTPSELEMLADAAEEGEEDDVTSSDDVIIAEDAVAITTATSDATSPKAQSADSDLEEDVGDPEEAVAALFKKLTDNEKGNG